MTQKTTALVPARLPPARHLPQSELLPAAPRWVGSAEQRAIAHDLQTRRAAAAATAQEALQAVASEAVGRMHVRVGAVHAEAAEAIAAVVGSPRPRLAQAAVDDFAQTELGLLRNRHFAILEAGAYQVGVEVNRPFQPAPPKPGLLRRLIGG